MNYLGKGKSLYFLCPFKKLTKGHYNEVRHPGFLPDAISWIQTHNNFSCSTIGSFQNIVKRHSFQFCCTEKSADVKVE